MNKAAYLKMFVTETAALSWMRMHNQACRNAGNLRARSMYVVADGPEDNFAVMDLRSAIKMEALYKWEV